MAIRDDLIAVFGPTPVSDIEKSPAYQKIQAQYASDESFLRVKDEVEQAKKFLEQVFAGQTRAEQLKTAIWELLSRRRSPDRDLFYGLIVSGYRNRPDYWNQKQQDHFEQAWTLIQLKYDFFLSFTSRFEKVAGENPVNTRYQHFIRSEIADEYDNADRKKTNLLAAAIHRVLSDAQHVGYFYPHTKTANKTVKTELEDAVRDSVVFVQLIQNILFVIPITPPEAEEPLENFCFWEYERALEAYGDGAKGRMQMAFVGGEDAYVNLVKAFHVPPSYKNWYKHVGHNGVPYLQSTPKFDPDKIAQLRQTLVEKVKPLLDDVWNRLLTTVPE